MMMMVSGAGVCADSMDTVVLLAAVVVRFYYCSQLLVICDRPTDPSCKRPPDKRTI